MGLATGDSSKFQSLPLPSRCSDEVILTHLAEELLGVCPFHSGGTTKMR